MTDDELKAIEERANAATPGPWEVEQKECTVLRAPNGPLSDQSLMGDEQYYPWTPDRIEDWQFIAAARTDVPHLVAEVRRLRDEERLWQHERSLLDADTQRGITDCSTPLFQRVRNIVEQLGAAERKIERLGKQLAK